MPRRRDRVQASLARHFAPLVELPRWARKSIAFGADLGLLFLSSFLAFAIRLGHFDIKPLAFFAFVLIAVAAWLGGVFLTNPYRMMARFAGGQTLGRLGLSMAVMALLLTFVLLVAAPPNVPRTLAVLQPLLFFVLVSLVRVLVSKLLVTSLAIRDREGAFRRILVYGAGSPARQLGYAIAHEPRLKLIGFVDPGNQLGGGLLEGSPVWQAERLESIVYKLDIDELFIADPALVRAEKRRLVERLRHVTPDLTVRTLPSLSELAFDQVQISDLRQIRIEDLLGRDPVTPDLDLMRAQIADRTVLVTGAGGSIGSELARQILAIGPSRLILADNGEFALYRIDEELRAAANYHHTRIVARLADLTSEQDCERLFAKYRPDTVFHAAAYKHVPLVEENVCAGVRNNVVGTLHAVLAAERHGCSRFTLISTDKAVRPTNVMGASKRVCELIIQARATAQTATTYSAVRFGNVLGSSGSVVPKFREQIAAGGPVTVTRMDATRYFMTITEAAQLVLQAGALAQSGEIFLLDMGEAVTIGDLARSMIELSGRSVRDAANPDGDISIEEIGLRPGEKMVEELLIGGHKRNTSHERIFIAEEEGVSWGELQPILADLATDLNEDREMAIRTRLLAMVPGFHPDRDRAPRAEKGTQEPLRL